MKKALLAGLCILLLTILNSCQPDEPEYIAFEETLELTELGKDPYLAKLMSDFTGQSLNGRTASTEMPFGTLDYRNIVTRIASEDQPKPNYTIKLIPPDSVENTREFLVLIGAEEGYWGYIMQYQADEDNIHLLNDQSQFTGTVHILNLNRVVQSVNHFKNGEPIVVSDGRMETTYTNCDCEIRGGASTFTGPETGDSGLTDDYRFGTLTLNCVCDAPSSFDGSDAGGGGRTYLPGEPVGDNPFDDGGSGGGSGGTGRTPSDGIEEPGDDIGTISNDLPVDIVAINADSEFIAMLQDDPDIWDCYNAMLSAGAYDIIRNAYDIKQTYTTIALVQEAIRTACGDGESDPESIHLLLDGLGFIPVIGEGFDIANGILYIKEGDFYNAGFSFIAIVPVAGDVAGKGTKYVLKAVNVSDEVFDAAKRVITVIKTVPSNVRKALAEKILKLDFFLRAKLAGDLIANPELIDEIIKSPELIDAWKKLHKSGNTISDALRSNKNVLTWFSKNSDEVTGKVTDDLLEHLDGKTIENAFEDAQGRLVVTTSSRTSTRVVATVEKTASGEIKAFKYKNAYNKAGQPGKPPLSANRLTPDFSGNPDWLYPVTGNQKNIVRVKLTGKRNGVGGDFDLANKAAKIEDLVPPGKWKPDDYTWHHLDDFDPVTGESTMQLVRTSDHVGSLPHSGSAKQYSNYNNVDYK